jgi:hypothetical protein
MKIILTKKEEDIIDSLMITLNKGQFEDIASLLGINYLVGGEELLLKTMLRQSSDERELTELFSDEIGRCGHCGGWIRLDNEYCCQNTDCPNYK